MGSDERSFRSDARSAHVDAKPQAIAVELTGPAHDPTDARSVDVEEGNIPTDVLPDYRAIRRRLLTLCLLSAFVMFALENLMFALYVIFPDFYGEFNTPIYIYLINCNVIPPVINFSAVIVAWLIEKKCRNEHIQNFAPIGALVIICTVIASAHWLYPVTMGVFCVPIFMSSVYGIRRTNVVTTVLCSFGLALAVVFRYTYEYNVNDNSLFPDALIAYMLLIASALFSEVLIDLLHKHKQRLIASAIEASAAKEEAQKASNAKSEFLADMSHEIRTPLNAVIGMTEVIYRKSKEPDTRECASDVLQAGNALLSIIGEIIDISKIESGEMELQETDYELEQLINDSYNLVSLKIQEKGLSSEIVWESDLPRMLRGDEYRLRQIIVNLLSNAVKYTDEGNVALKVSGHEEGDSFILEVKVEDTGIGIREEELPDLFEKFNRTKEVKDRRIEGVGLGLNITRQLVALMDGTIEVNSVYGEGSTFTLRIPQKIVNRIPDTSIHDAYLTLHSELGQYAQSFVAPDARILVVDDVLNNLRVIRRLLEDTKINIDTVMSGEECIRKVKEQRYDLILMDHMMPGMDGVETLAAIKELDSPNVANVPVVALTANAMVYARDEYLKYGFADYLSKPVHGSVLEGMILRFLPNEKIIACLGDDPEVVAWASDEVKSASDVMMPRGAFVDDEPPKREAGDSRLQPLADLLPEIDTAEGMKYCADDLGFYLSMLEDFAKADNDATMLAAFEAKDWGAYRIAAHSLKNLARTVGFEQLADESLALEMAAKELDAEAIEAAQDSFMAHCTDVKSKLTAFFEE